MAWLDVFLKLVPAFAGGGVIGSALTIWWNWGVEKKRLRMQRRQQLVDSWRRELLPMMEQPPELGRGVEKYPFMRTVEYASLRPHLSPTLVKQLEGQALIVEVEGTFPRRQIIEEIARIERRWGLV